jgi:tetratricopeptide (TPR) repeat protein
MSTTNNSAPRTGYRRSLRRFFTADTARVFSEPGSWAIIGDSSVGKSTFSNLAIGGALQCTGQENNGLHLGQRLTTLEAKGTDANGPNSLTTWFKRVVVLNPREHEIWGEVLDAAGYDARTTLVVLDAPFQSGDSGEVRRSKIRRLNQIRRGAGHHSDPFHIVLAIQRAEYAEIAKALGPYLQVHEIRWNPQDIWRVLTACLEDLGVTNAIGEDPAPEILDVIMQRSAGVPEYCRSLAALLSTTKQSFSHDTLKSAPTGLTNLVLEILENSCPDEATRTTFMSLIALLAETGEGFSASFFDRVINNNELVQESQRTALRETLTAVAATHQESIFDQFPPRPEYRLHTPWQRAVRGLANGSVIADSRYFSTRGILVHCWQGLSEFKDRLASSLLPPTLSQDADFLLLPDLARISDKAAEQALGTWRNSVASSPPATNVGASITLLFYEMMLSRGFRSAARGEAGLERTVQQFEAAFAIHAEAKDLTGYIGHLREYGLERATTAAEFTGWRQKIERAFAALLRITDSVDLALNYRASFWTQVREFEKAEDDLRKLEATNSENIIDALWKCQTLAAFFTCLGDALWWKDLNQADNQFLQGESYFQKGLAKLNGVSPTEQLDRAKSRFLTSYARALITRAEKHGRTLESRRELAERAVQRLREAQAIGPEDIGVTNLLGEILLRYGWLMTEYRIDQHQALAAARQMLEASLKYPDDPRRTVTFHLLGRLLYHYLPQQKRDLATAISYLKTSATLGGPLQEAVANRELGRLYIELAQGTGPNPTQKLHDLQLAEAHLTRATVVHPGISDPQLLLLVYPSLIRLAYLRQNPRGAQQHVQKLREVTGSIAKLTQFTGKSFSHVLIDVGDALFADREAQAALKTFEEANRADDTLWYPLARMGACYARLKKTRECLRSFREATARAKSGSAFGTIRNGINEAKQSLYRLLTRDELLDFQNAMLENSHKAYCEAPDHWKSASDLSEDLFSAGKFSEAIVLIREANSRTARYLRTGILTDTATRQWAKDHVRGIRTRQKWILAKSHVGIDELGAAKRYAWQAARLDASERGWAELTTMEDEKFKRPEFVIRAYTEYLKQLHNLNHKQRVEALLEWLPRLMRRARNNFQDIGDATGQALPSKYFEILRLLEPKFESLGVEKGKRSLYAAGRLMQVGQYQLSLELFMNTLRLGPQSPFRSDDLAQLAAAAQNSGRPSLAREVLQQALHLQRNDVRRHPLPENLGQPGGDLSPFETAIVNELKGKTQESLEFYRTLLQTQGTLFDPACVGNFAPTEVLRLIVDAFIVQGEMSTARVASERLKSLATFPENLYAECLSSHLASGVAGRVTMTP